MYEVPNFATSGKAKAKAKAKKNDKKHWFTKSLKFRKPRLSPGGKQYRSQIGQQSLPGMEGEAERSMPRPGRRDDT